MIFVSACATSANLGPGFDCLGVALELCNQWTMQEAEEWRVGKKIIQPREHLLAQSMEKTLTILGKSIKGAEIGEVEANIPRARGLGSSAACITAGIAAAYALSKTPVNREDMLQIAAEMEGHGDNAAPAIFGGGRIAFSQQGRFSSEGFFIHPSLHWIALIPSFSLLTEVSRGALPKAVSYPDAACNIARGVLTVRALEEGNVEKLQGAMEDRLHQPYRLPLIPGGEAILSFCRQQGAAAYLSGAGPTLMAVTDDAEMTEKLQREFADWNVRELSIRKMGFECRKIAE